MSTETQPSKHAMRTASIIDGNLYISVRARLANQRVMASAIDQHAIAPAVAERDRRIAKLVSDLRTAYDKAMGGKIHPMDAMEAILAKHGGAHE